MSQLRRLPEIAGAFLKLGCMSFGGPVAHLSYLREEFVAKRRWLDDSAYADLVALCQFLPGPASSQVVFGLGMRRAGLAGALTAALGFTLPSALLMILCGYGAAFAGNLAHAGWLHGLKLAAVAVVAQAVWGMGRTLCPDFPRLVIAGLAAAAAWAVPSSLTQAGIIAAGAGIGWWYYHRQLEPTTATGRALTRQHLWAAGTLALALTLLLVLPVVAAASGEKSVRVFDGFYRAGALVFGGGHVVLPLLRAEVVPPGWISDDAFLAGYGAAQAMPGPLFTFAAYLGTVIGGGPHAWAWGMECLVALFLPGWLLIGGAQPFWHLLRHKVWARAALLGANAAVVGLLLAALYNPVGREGVKSPVDLAIAAVAFVLLAAWRSPAWLIVALCALAGHFSA